MNKYCELCKLYKNCKTPCVSPMGDDKAQIVFIGETQTLRADEEGQAIFSKGHNIIKEIINRLEVPWYYFNAVRCTPYKDGKVVKPNALQKDSCKAFTMHELLKVKPKVIVAIGNIAVEQLTGITMSMEVLHGKIIYHPQLNCYIVPTFSTAILYTLGEKESLYKKFFLDDIASAVRLLQTPMKRRIKKEIIKLENPVDIKDFLISLKGLEEIALDLETTGLDEFTDSITDVSITTNVNNGYHITWEDMQEHFDLFKEVLESGIKVIGHNIKFDKAFLSHAGIEIKNIYFDTMLAFHTLEMSFEGRTTEGLFKLKNISWFYTTDGGHDRIMEEFGGIAGFQKNKLEKKEKEKAEKAAEREAKRKTKKTTKKKEEVETSTGIVVNGMVRRKLLNNELITEQELSYAYNYSVNVLKKEIEEAKVERLTYYAAMDTNVTYRLYKLFKNRLTKEGYDFVFYNIIMPLYDVYYTIEKNGIMIDFDYIKEVKAKNEIEIENIAQGFFKKIGKEINLSSTQQLAEVMKKKLKIKVNPKFKTPKGAMSTDMKALTEYAKQAPELEDVLRYRGLIKETSTYLDGFKDLAKEDTHRIHPRYLQISTATGRSSCIAKGTQITILNGFKNIEDIKIGEYVYCYDDLGNIKLSKVKNVFDNGIRDCVKLKWQSSGNHKKTGELIITDEHEIKTKYQGWQPVKNLKRYDKLFHLYRTPDKRTGRIRLYGTNSIDFREEWIVKESIFKAPVGNSYHIHHKDHNKLNNDLSNLEVLPRKEHASLHAREAIEKGNIKWQHLIDYKVPTGKDNHKYIHKTKAELIQMFYDADGKSSKTSMDSKTYVKKCKEAGIDLNKLRAEYAEYKTEYGTNHTVTSISPAGKFHVYDLEVEEYHNFIANEICVHNCINPSLHTTPRDNKLRNMIIPKEGFKFLLADLSQVELRVLALLADDYNMIQAFESGHDFHTATACNMFNIPMEEFNKENKDHNEKRSIAKIINFSIVYLKTAKSLAVDLNVSVEEAQKFMDTFFTSYSNVSNWIKSTKMLALKQGYVETLYGRRRYLPFIKSSNEFTRESQYRRAINSPVQGTASDITSIGLIRIQDYIDKYFKKEVFMVGTIHDSVILEVQNQLVEQVAHDIIPLMTENIPRVPIVIKADLDILDKWVK